MVQLNLLSGKEAGAVRLIKRFPALVGRSASALIRAEEPGVWEQHFQLQLEPRRGVRIHTLQGARTLVNGVEQTDCLLRNGDLIEAGALRLQFWLSPTRQRSWRAREWLTWWAFGTLCLGEVWLIYCLQTW